MAGFQTSIIGRSCPSTEAQPFPEEAIERTDGRQTGKGCSTTGIKAQFIISRLDEALGLGGWRTHRKVVVKDLTTSSGRKAYEAVCDPVLELGAEDEGDPKKGTATILFYELPEGFWAGVEAQKEERPGEHPSIRCSPSRPVWLPRHDSNMRPGD